MGLNSNLSSEKTYRICPVGAIPGGEAYLLLTPGRQALIDTGYSFCAPELARNIRTQLGHQRLDYIILTHSHYDHASGCPVCCRQFPEAVVIAGKKAAQVFAKPSARAAMARMNAHAAARLGLEPDGDRLEGLRVDRIVEEGDRIDFGDFSLAVYETPGHTKCSLAFFSPENGLLISSETLGLPMGKGLNKPGYLIGYQMTIDSIRKIQALQPEELLIPHNGLYQEEEPGAFLEQSLFWAERIKDMVVERYQQGASQEDIVRSFQDIYFYQKIGRVQIEEAFLLNASIMVRMLLKECLGVTLDSKPAF